MTLGLGRSTSSVCAELLCVIEKLLFSMTAGLKGKIERLGGELDIYRKYLCKGYKPQWCVGREKSAFITRNEKPGMNVLPSTAPAFSPS